MPDFTVVTTGYGPADTATIQAAVNANPGRQLWITGVNTTITSAVTVSDDHTGIDGDITLTAAGLSSAAPMFRFENCDYNYFGPGLFLDGNWLSGIIGLELRGALLGEFHLIGDRWPVGINLDCNHANATQNSAMNHLYLTVRNGIKGFAFKGKSGQQASNNIIERMEWWGAASSASTGIDFIAYADNNHVRRAFINLAAANHTGVIYNSQTPASDLEVYENHIDAIIEASAAGAVAIDGNRTWQSLGLWPSFCRIRLSGSSTPTFNIQADSDIVLVNSDTNGKAVHHHSFNQPDRIYLSSDQLSGVGGSPTLSNVNRHNVFALDAAAQEWVATGIEVPRDWSAFDLILVHTNLGAGAGNVVWQGGVSTTFAAASSITSPTMGGNVTVAAPAQNVLAQTTLRGAVAAGSQGVVQVAITRVAADAGDTLGNDAGVVGVILERVLT